MFQTNLSTNLIKWLVENKFFFEVNMCNTLGISLTIPFVNMIDNPLGHEFCVLLPLGLHMFDSWWMHSQHHVTCAMLLQYQHTPSRIFAFFYEQSYNIQLVKLITTFVCLFEFLESFAILALQSLIWWPSFLQKKHFIFDLLKPILADPSPSLDGKYVFLVSINVEVFFPTYKVDILYVDEYKLFIKVSSWIKVVIKDSA